MYKIVFYIKPQLEHVFHSKKCVYFCHSITAIALLIESFAALTRDTKIFTISPCFKNTVKTTEEDTPEIEILLNDFYSMLARLDGKNNPDQQDFDYISIVKKKTEEQFGNWIEHWPQPKTI